MLNDTRYYVSLHARREAIRLGWDGFKSQGWKAPPPYPDDDPRFHFWMNGVEGAEQARKQFSFNIEDVPGWRD